MFGGLFGTRPLVGFFTRVASQSAVVVLATLIGGYVLTALNLREEPVAQDVSTRADTERALTREYVKSLREGRNILEDVVEVQPTALPVSPSNGGQTVVAKGTRGEAAIVVPPARSSIRKEDRIHADTTDGMAPALGQPMVLTPSTVASVDNDPRAVRPRTTEPTGVGAVFSTLSNLIGGAANATGDSINFMIDLPGRAFGRKAEEIAAPTGATRPQRTEPVPASSPAGATQPEIAPLRFARP